jgi:hypothetical protein
VLKPSADSSEQTSAGGWAALADWTAQEVRSKVAASSDGLHRLVIGFDLPVSAPEFLSEQKKFRGFYFVHSCSDKAKLEASRISASGKVEVAPE